MRKKYIYIFLLFLFVFGLVLFYFNFSRQFKPPEFKTIQSLELLSTDGPNAKFIAVASFYNPNNFDAQLLNSEIKVISKDFEVARISQTNTSKIMANSDFNVDFYFTINISELSFSHGLSGLIENMLSEKREIPVHFSGYSRVKSNGSIYKIPIEIDEVLTFK